MGHREHSGEASTAGSGASANEAIRVLVLIVARQGWMVGSVREADPGRPISHFAVDEEQRGALVELEWRESEACARNPRASARFQHLFL